MPRRWPLLPTLIVAAAVVTMIALGFWQLRRVEEKAALIARYHQAQAMNSDVPWPRTPQGIKQSLFRWSGFECARVVAMRSTSARSIKGQGGLAWIARCAVAGGGEAEVALGWAPPPREYTWAGGEAVGTIGPGGEFGGILYASMQPPGLQPLAPPDPEDLPNNHLAYAGQWFFFALTAAVIYVLALRRRQRP
jgi:surfeit locus 1 family protein